VDITEEVSLPEDLSDDIDADVKKVSLPCIVYACRG